MLEAGPEAHLAERPLAIGARGIAAAAIALVGGIGLALLDACPGFDAIGISAVGLLAVAAAAATLDGRRP